MTNWSSRSMLTRELVERLRDRLTADDYRWAAENADNVEWEIAVEVIKSAVSRGQLTMTKDEVAELAGIESHRGHKPCQPSAQRWTLEG